MANNNRFFLESPRLKLIPLTITELRTLLHSVPEFEQLTKMIYAANDLSCHLINVFTSQLHKMEETPNDWLWLTFWMILSKETNQIMGSIDFKGCPDSQKSVEIGYGLGEDFRHLGYMKEACHTLCDYGFSQGLKAITAETDFDNKPSEKVLTSNGFALTHQTNQSNWWILKP